MRKFIELRKKLSCMNSFSKTVIKLGALMALCFCVVGLTAFAIAPLAPNYFGAMSIFYGSVEAAPASLAAGVIAAFICDAALKQRK